MQSGYNLNTVISPQYTPLQLTRLPDKEKILIGPNILLGQLAIIIKGVWIIKDPSDKYNLFQAQNSYSKRK